MMNYVVAIPLDRTLADFIGKGNDEGSIAFHNRKMDSDIIVGLQPSSIEEKFYAVAEVMLISQQILISTANIDKLFGEMLVACSLLKKHVIFTDENDVAAFVAGVKLADFEISPREELLQKILSIKNQESSAPVRVDLDHAFPVKGIGSVALGIVTKGTLKVHDELHYSSGKMASVKSIQSQDVDVPSAGFGTRVGVALKGIEHSEIEKGDLLTKEKVAKTDSISATIEVSPMAKEEIAAGIRHLFVSNFSRATALIEKAEGSSITMKLERPIAVEKGDKFLLIREKSPRIFAIGTIL